jgi:hypothetical protein
MRMKFINVAANFIDPVDNCDPRHRQELEDARMIQEDRNAMSNLPGQPIYHEFNAWKYNERLAAYNQNNSKWK